MPANGSARAGLIPGHFLFTSESVGEGHPGVSQMSLENSARLADTEFAHR